MILANIFNDVLRSLFTGFLSVMLVSVVAAIFGVWFLKKNDGARKLAKKIARAAAERVAKQLSDD
jgi:hypothetical protein